MIRNVLVYAFAAGLIAMAPGCKPKTSTPAPDVDSLSRHLAEGTNVVLITLDTTRADRIGSYGYSSASTPAIDALAARGVQFDQAFAQVPLTLPSHATMMTGRYPRELGVRVNARDSLGDDHTTLASEAKKHGYATGAFIGSSVLDRRYGLDRGFDVYRDDMGRSKGLHAHSDPERRGGEVTEEALAWLSTVKDRNFFSWIHYYDAHDPYDAPKPVHNPLAPPYDNEIAYVDSQVQRVVDWLEAQGLTGRTLIVLVGDHGEGFGEHGERGHTIFVYETNIHVPLVFVHPSFPPGRRIDSVVEVVDVFPTVLSLLGWSQPEGLLSLSLADAIHGAALSSSSRGSYGEAHDVSWSFGWAEQRSLTTAKWKYISSTRPELFDRSVDPGELTSVIEQYPDVARQMREALVARYDEMNPGSSHAVVLDAQSRRELESLGYLSGGAAPESQEFLTPGRPDPKDMLDAYHQMKRGFELLENGRPEQAIPQLEAAVRASPMSMGFHYLLGAAYQEAGRDREAIDSLEAALRLDPTYRSALSLLTKSLVALDRYDEAISHYEVALTLDPSNALMKGSLGQVLRRAGQTDKALAHLRQAVEAEPEYALALNELGIISQTNGDTKAAIGFYRRAVDAKPNGTEGLYNLATALLRAGQTSEAAPLLRRAVTLSPSLVGAVMTKGGDYAKNGKVEAARACFEAIADSEGVAVGARFNLAIMAARDGNRDAAVSAYQRVLEIDPAHEKSVAALVNLYLNAKKTREAVRTLRSALEHAPDSLSVLKPLASLLATAPQDDIRDGALAVELASRAARLTGRKDPVVLATLAAALAETGEFERAAQIAGDAIDLAREANAGRLADFVANQRMGYQAGRPFRDGSLSP